MTHLVQSGRCALLVCAALLAPPCAVAATTVVGDLPRAADRPLESLPGVDTEYGVLRIGGDTRLRTIVTATHTEEELDRALEILGDAARSLGILS